MDGDKQDSSMGESMNVESNTGRWTKAEHELFLKGLSEYGKDWKQIGSLIKTRTVVQIRTHAQKYFLATKKIEDPDGVAPMKVSTAKKRSSSSSLLSGTSTPRAKTTKKRKDSMSNEDAMMLDVASPRVTMTGMHHLHHMHPQNDHYHLHGSNQHFNTHNQTSGLEGGEHNLENLDKIFDMVENWSSGSDEGTPSGATLEDLDFLKPAPSSAFPPLPSVEEADSSASSTPSVSRAALPSSTQYQLQTAVPMTYEFHPVSSHPQPPVSSTFYPQQQPYSYHSNQFSNGNAARSSVSSLQGGGHQQQIPPPPPPQQQIRPALDDVPPLPVTPTPPELQDGPFVDPLPPSLEYMLIGRWIDTMTE